MKARLVVMMALGACGGSEKARPAAPEVEPPPAPAAAIPTKAGLPDTPAGTAASAWLESFNSADAQRIAAFVTQYKSEETADEWLGFSKQTGGFDLVSVEKSDPLEVKFVVKEKNSPTTAIGWLKVKAATPTEIDSFTLLAIPPGQTTATFDIKVDAATRSRIVDNAIAKLEELYVFPDVATKMGEALRAHQKAGAYDNVSEGPALAKLLTEHLRAVSRDKHLGVMFSPGVVPPDKAGNDEPSDEAKANMRAQLEKMNCGFKKAEKLDGNIGIIKFNMFGNTEVCGAKATEAFAAISGVDAVIFDLRDNGGGHPDMVAFVSSYLFDKKTHLNDIYDRAENKTTQHWTKPDVKGAKLSKQPVFVLTSKKTFSGAEEFTYNLKNLKRATIIGETTGGGAHPTTGRRLDDHFMIAVPFARAINPITKTNWEGTGVEPDVKVPADQALDTAMKLAVEQIAKKKKKK